MYGPANIRDLEGKKKPKPNRLKEMQAQFSEQKEKDGGVSQFEVDHKHARRKGLDKLALGLLTAEQQSDFTKFQQNLVKAGFIKSVDEVFGEKLDLLKLWKKIRKKNICCSKSPGKQAWRICIQ